MFFYKDDQTLYLANWEYNAALIISELETIANNNGGRVAPKRAGFVVNRTLRSAIREKTAFLQQLEEAEKRNPGNNEKRIEAIKKTRANLEEWEKIDNTPRKVSGIYISFVLDGYYYYFQFNDNPFMEHYHQKTKVVDGRRSRDAYLEEIDKNKYMFDCLFSLTCNDTERREIANIIFNELVKAPECEKAIETTKKRVSNTYNNGYHYETIRTPERFETIDF